MLTFIEDSKYLEELHKTKNINCVITTPELVNSISERFGIVTSKSPRKAFIKLHNYLNQNTEFYWKNFKSEIFDNAKIHPRAYITEKNVKIGDGVVVEANATILERTIIEENVIIRAGTVVGTEGFEMVRIDNEIIPISHCGGARICKNVEIQANCGVSRSVFGGFTEIGEQTKLDNLVHVAHNVIIGKRCRIAACAMIAGSAIVGNDVWIGPSASISSGVRIGDNANITIGSVVTKDVLPGERVTGNFAISHDKFIKFLKSIR